MSWLKHGFRALRGLVKLSSIFLSLRAFARSRLKASLKAFRRELISQGLPPGAVEELVSYYRELGEALLGSLLSKIRPTSLRIRTSS
ncbi:hypothetical protein DRO32_04385 [Candidatus Bathyarchaeota archaeon]|mgnify:CR=1 FL=1|nr:MAG: hypothetical protein DRO32_04385 [Candidatus Bathyarchaeota archaeon]